MRVAAALLVLSTGLAHADSDDLVTRPLTLAAGELVVALTVEANLSRGAIADPLSLAPAAWYGVTDRWTFGIVHGNASVDRIAAGAGLCLQGDECDRYSLVGVEARWRAHHAIAPRARFLVRDFDPGQPAITLGALARVAHGRFVATSDPYLRLGLANRDQGNRAALVVPVWLGVQPTCRWLVALRTGYDADLAVATDGYHIPVGLAVTARPTASLDVGLEVGFASLLGPQTDLKSRAALLTLRWTAASVPLRSAP